MTFPEWTSPDGRIRLIHADCLEVLPGLSGIDAVVTDPPYGHGYKSNACCLVAKGKWAPTRGPESMEWNGDEFDPTPWLMFPKVVFWGANHFASRLPDSAAWFVWDKRDGVGHNNLSDCELAWCSVGGSARLTRHLWMGLCRDSEIGRHLHPTQKPVEVMIWTMHAARIAAGETILDPFAGSCTTAIACIRTDRRCIAIEREEKYWQIGIDRCKREYARTALFDSAEAVA